MQWKESAIAIGTLAAITVGSTWTMYSITEKKLDSHREDMRIIDANHREDMKSMDSKWERLFEKMDSKLEIMDAKWERLLLKDYGK